MTPTRALNRRSFLRTVSGAAVAGGALLAVTGRAGAGQLTDRDSGPGADPAGRGRGVTTEPGDADFARPRFIGDVVESDPPPGRRTGFTDSDGGPAADLSGQGGGRNAQQVRAARCAGVRQRIARLEATSPRTAETESRIQLLRTYLDRWRCR